VNLAFVAVMVGWGRRGPAGKGPRSGQTSAKQAEALAVAAFGLTAALIKSVTATFAWGLGVLFTSWQLYAMIVAGALGLFLV
jgi:hypothetical protein